MNKSLIVKSLSAVVVTSFLLSSVTYSIVRDNRPVAIDFSAFKNAANNINYISHNNKLRPSEAVVDVTGSIVKTIEKELRGKIINSRYAYKAKPKSNPFIKESVIAKNSTPQSSQSLNIRIAR